MIGQVNIHVIRSTGDFPEWATPQALALFLNEYLRPYEDPVPDIMRGIEDALIDTPVVDNGVGESRGNRRGGFVLLAEEDEKLVGGLVMLRTGMKGYVPENLLLFVAVDASFRGQGIGRQLVERSLALCEGSVKLHVEYENPAKRLYERIGFTTKYAEMRYE